MPRVATLGAIIIAIYNDDHNPPHFHAKARGMEALVDIQTLAILEGELRSNDMRTVIAWAKENQAFLMTTWNAAKTA